jgi:hypothetical protein
MRGGEQNLLPSRRLEGGPANSGRHGPTSEQTFNDLQAFHYFEQRSNIRLI